jgi:peptidoglycan/xylan/chitin deacetylase (PgdA/CDA1 family)
VRKPMNIHLTFDVEIWCNGWDSLDQSFPQCFERYVYGRSRHGDYALPKTLEILNRHGLTGIFFVEPLFAARFGIDYLSTIVRMIRDAGQEIELHLHPEWTDEIHPAILENSATKRQHLTYYTLAEQSALIAYASALLQSAGSGPITAFRAGSFAANLDTFEALRQNGIKVDSSLNRCYGVSGEDIRDKYGLDAPFTINQVRAYPVTVFTDGLGRDRPAHVAACSFSEMKDALWSAKEAGASDFVVVSHNFEMLKPGSSAPSWIVVRRFERLCAYLAQHRIEFPVGAYATADHATTDHAPADRTSAMDTTVHPPSARLASTLQRHVEQLVCRIT